MLNPNSPRVKKWSSIVDDFDKSGLSPSKYCEETGVSAKTLYTWRRNFGKISNPRKRTKEFVKMQFSSDDQSSTASAVDESVNLSSGIHIEYSNRFKISLDKDFDESTFLKAMKVFNKVLC